MLTSLKKKLTSFPPTQKILGWLPLDKRRWCLLAHPRLSGRTVFKNGRTYRRCSRCGTLWEQ